MGWQTAKSAYDAMGPSKCISAVDANVESKRQAHEDAKVATAAKEAAIEATWCQCKNDNLASYNDALETGQKNDQIRTNSATFIGKIECMVEVKEDATYEAGDSAHRDQLVDECVAKFAV